MAARTTRARGGSQRRDREQQEMYFHRLKPVEYDYGQDAHTGNPQFEIRGFDDRDDNEVLKLQFCQRGARQKVSVMTTDLAGLAELIDDLQDLHDQWSA